jgi:hypothetical protein
VRGGLLRLVLLIRNSNAPFLAFFVISVKIPLKEEI